MGAASIRLLVAGWDGLDGGGAVDQLRPARESDQGEHSADDQVLVDEAASAVAHVAA